MNGNDEGTNGTYKIQHGYSMSETIYKFQKGESRKRNNIVLILKEMAVDDRSLYSIMRKNRMKSDEWLAKWKLFKH